MPSEPVATPGQFLAAFVDAWHARDGARIGALFAEDGDFVNVTGLWWHDRDAIARAHDHALKSYFAETTLQPGRTEVRRMGEAAAIVRSRMRLSGQRDCDGRIAGDRITIITFVLERRGAGWQAVAAQNTDVHPGRETHLAGDTLEPVRYRPG